MFFNSNKINTNDTHNFNLSLPTTSYKLYFDFDDNLILLCFARAFVIYLLLYLFIGITKLLELLMVSTEQIINQKISMKWDKTVANFTLIAFTLNAFEIMYPSIELIHSGFQAYTTGPLLIIVNFSKIFFMNYLELFLT